MISKTLEDYSEAVGDILEEEHSYPKGVQKVLDVLQDGRWHTHREIMERSQQMRYGARIWEAKKNHGLDIEYKRNGMDHCYRWVKN